MKVLAVCGSPRKGGNTEAILRVALDVLESRGIGTELIALAGKRIQPCTACMACRNARNALSMTISIRFFANWPRRTVSSWVRRCISVRRRPKRWRFSTAPGMWRATTAISSRGRSADPCRWRGASGRISPWLSSHVVHDQRHDRSGEFILEYRVRPGKGRGHGRRGGAPHHKEFRGEHRLAA